MLPPLMLRSVVTDEDVAVAITLTGADPDADPINFILVSQSTNGVLSGTLPDLLYTPDPDSNGTDFFTFKTNDGLDDLPIATVTINVTAVNDTPVANAQSVNLAEDASVAVSLTGSDVDGDDLSYTVTNQPLNGVLTGTAPDLVYTPADDYNGGDSFTFVVNDGSVDSPAAVVNIAINPVNDAPTAANLVLVLDEDGSAAVTLSGADIDGDALSYSIVAAPVHGTLTGTAPDLTYTPAANFNGSDSFTYVSSDGQVDSPTALVSITVNPVNDAPVADSQQVSTLQDTALGITLSASDVDGDIPEYTIISPPANGSLNGNAPDLVYMPDLGYSGADLFSFIASDGTLDSIPVLVDITVTPAGPSVVFEDDFETNKGWITNPVGSDTATTGMWERANPEAIVYNGDKQLGSTVSGSNDLVTGALAGSSAGSYDIDGGTTSIRSPSFTLPTGQDLVLSFYYYLSHASNSSSADFLAGVGGGQHHECRIRRVRGEQ